MDEYEKRFNEAAYPQQDPLQQKQDARQAYQEYQQQQAQAQAAQAAAGAGAAQTQGGTGQYTGGNYDNINAMYDAYQQSQLSALEQAYNQSRSNAQAARDELPGQYQARANDLATQYERNRRNLNQQAAANGLNTGAGSQMQLALGSNYQRDYGSLRTAEQKALNDADRQLRDMEASYQSSVQQAIADNDFQRAQALLSEYQNQYARQLQQAQTLASYGDFSAYLNIPGYTQQQVDAMRNAWIAANPDMAYNTGAITADQYKAMTGSYPPGYKPTGGSGSPNTGGLVAGAASGLVAGTINPFFNGGSPSIGNSSEYLLAAAVASGQLTQEQADAMRNDPYAALRGAMAGQVPTGTDPYGLFGRP